MTELEAIGFVKVAVQKYDEIPVDPDTVRISSLLLMGEDGFVAEARVPSGDIFKLAGTSNSLVADKYQKVDSKRWVGKEKER